MKNEKNNGGEILVWEWQIRVLHWVNAFLIIGLALLILGAEGLEWMGASKRTIHKVEKLHAVLGYLFVLTFSLRILWGFLGNSYAQWRDLIPYNEEKRRALKENIAWYLSGFRGDPPPTVGHNPLASLFYIVLFVVLVGQVITGVVLAGLEFRFFPGFFLFRGLEEETREGIEDIAEEVHEFGLWFLLFFLGAHLVGLLAHEFKQGRGLFSSMITGKKILPKG